jgi:hypothetical protein
VVDILISVVVGMLSPGKVVHREGLLGEGMADKPQVAHCWGRPRKRDWSLVHGTIVDVPRIPLLDLLR